MCFEDPMLTWLDEYVELKRGKRDLRHCPWQTDSEKDSVPIIRGPGEIIYKHEGKEKF